MMFPQGKPDGELPLRVHTPAIGADDQGRTYYLRGKSPPSERTFDSEMGRTDQNSLDSESFSEKQKERRRAHTHGKTNNSLDIT
ncbi:hypothetical protein PGT21_020502 [Puccinia graminis f. sp. tritici]|uniref:Uncharacterized protein n=1 Tax=Puccinia graminis f. sp. tritici TaxID=56615 RepID=A0A5B0QFW4_PUCGR|nr:hypothetical protein PGT21_020502 [Puccinia graminis f. sp. tritici]